MCIYSNSAAQLLQAISLTGKIIVPFPDSISFRFPSNKEFWLLQLTARCAAAGLAPYAYLIFRPLQDHKQSLDNLLECLPSLKRVEKTSVKVQRAASHLDFCSAVRRLCFEQQKRCRFWDFVYFGDAHLVLTAGARLEIKRFL